MQKIDEGICDSTGRDIFLGAPSDIRFLAKYCNMLADKINELIDEIEFLKERGTMNNTNGREVF